jgi:hypothetical protein
VRVAKTGVAASFGLFRKTAIGWTHMASLNGGYGTTGQEVVASLPLSAIGISQSARIDDVSAFSSLGGYLGSNDLVLDRLSLDA